MSSRVPLSASSPKPTGSVSRFAPVGSAAAAAAANAGAQPPSPAARPSSASRRQVGTGGASGQPSVFQSAAQANLPSSSPTSKAVASSSSTSSTSLPRLGKQDDLASASSSSHAPKLIPSSPSSAQSSSPLSPGALGSHSPGLPSLLEQGMSDNRRFSNGMSPIPSSLARPGSAGGSEPAFGRRASRPPSRSGSPSSEDTGSGASTGRPHFNHAAANARDNGEPDFEVLDEQLSRSSVWRELHRVVRMCASQPSCDRMVMTLERQTRYLIGASCVRLFLVQRDGLVHYSRAHPFPLQTGIVGFVRAKKEIVCLTQPTQDERFTPDIDQVHDRPVPTALMCVPVEADSASNNGANGNNASGGGNAASASAGGKDLVAVFQAFKEGAGESFTTRDCKVLYRLGEFAGNMLRTSRSVDRAHALYNASLQSHKRSGALLDVAKTLASETNLDKVVGIIVSQVPELLDSDRCTLFFVDREREQLIVTKGASKGRAKNLVSWIFGQSNAPELPFPKGTNELRFSMHNGIAGHVAMCGETLNIVDAHQDPRFNSTMDKETGYRTRSMLTVPMQDSSGLIIGVLQAINKNPALPRFDSQDETLLKTFAAQAALAVRNARLFEKTESALRQSDALLEIANALSSELKIEGLIAIICSKVQVLLHCERCTVYILDKEKKELYTSASMSFGMGAALPIDKDRAKLIHFPMDRGIAGAVATTGQPLNIPDAYKEKRFNQAMDKETGFRTRAILCIAIKNSAQEVCGVLQVMNKLSPAGQAGGEWRFNEDDEQMLRAFAAQAAVAIENSKLFSNTEAALNHALSDQRNLKFMLSVTKNLFSDMHLTSMIDQMTMQVHHLLKADDCAVYLVDDAAKEFWLAKDDTHAAAAKETHTGPGGESLTAAKKFSFSVGIVGVVAASGDTIRISSAAHADARFSPLVDQRKGKTTHSILCCPIKAELPDGSSKIVGVISVRDEKDRGGFEQEEEKLLKVFSAQAAVAIMNSRRFTNIMDQAEIKNSDHSAADYLKAHRGMKLGSDDINTFQFKMEDIKMRGAIGTGSYGEVYRAEVVLPGNTTPTLVAVKKLHVRNLKAEQVDAFCKEASLMCQLNHSNIVGFIGAVTEPSNLCIITQYCLEASEQVVRDDGRRVAVKELKQGDKIFTTNGRTTQVIEPTLLRTEQMIRIADRAGRSYTVTPEHKVVLMWTREPKVVLQTAASAEDECHELLVEYLSQRSFQYTRRCIARYTLPGESRPASARDSADCPLLLNHCEAQLRLFASTWLTAHAADIVPTHEPFHVQAHLILDNWHPEFASGLTHLTTELPDAPESEEFSLAQSAATDASAVSEQFTRRVLFVDTAGAPVCKPAHMGDKCSILYELQHSSCDDAPQLSSAAQQAYTQKQLQRVWRWLGLARKEDHDLVVSEIRPTSSGNERAEQYAAACQSSMETAVRMAPVILSFGADARQRWSSFQMSASAAAAASIADCAVDSSLEDRVSIRLTFTDGLTSSTTIFTAEHPGVDRSLRSVLEVAAKAHQLSSPSFDLDVLPADDESLYSLCDAHLVRPVLLPRRSGSSAYSFVRFSVDHPEELFALANGVITHNCSRGSLADLLLDDKIWMNFSVKVKFALEAAQGMLYLHRDSNPVILHRDLKSDNLLVTQDWTIKVADFGLTRFISEKKQMTQVGTPMWMAPEIIMGRKYTEKADVYAFGIILWEILTRLEPYEEKEPMQIVVEVVNDGLRPTLPAECAESPLVPLMKDCWHTDPMQRPPFEKICERLKAIQAAIKPDDNSSAGVPGTSISKQSQQSAHGAHVAGDVSSPTNM